MFTQHLRALSHSSTKTP